MEGIEELIALFRKSGGKFENVALGHREAGGFYLYSPDSNKDTVVSCPAHLLVDINDIDVNREGLFIANTGNYKNSLEFLEKYFAFHFNRKMLDRYIEKKRHIDALSSRELSLITGIFPPGFRTGGCGELEFAKNQIISSHKIEYSGKQVIMPIATFLNHAKNGISFDTKEDAIFMSGKFSGEAFTIYNLEDVLGIADGYGFVTDTTYAYSLPLSTVTPNGTKVVINRNLGSTAEREGVRWPLTSMDRGTVRISWFPLYFEWEPLFPAKVARMVARETGLTAELFLNYVFRENLNALVPVAFQLRDSKNPYAQMAAAAAQRQLEVIGGTI